MRKSIKPHYFEMDLTTKKIHDLEYHVKEILYILGQDIESEGLKDTPTRVANYYVNFLFYNDDHKINKEPFESITTDQMVIVKNIDFYSLCEHHLLPIRGKCSVGYITGSKVIGLSKIPRIVEKYARRLQLQERMAHQIADELESILTDCQGVIVVIEAEHMCMSMRGIKCQGSMVTSVLRGVFREEPNTKEEFFLLIK